MSRGQRRGGGVCNAESAEDRVADEYANTAPPIATVWRGQDWGLARAGTKRESDVTPRVKEGGRGRQVEDDAAHRVDDVDAELEQPLTQRGHLRAGAGRARGAQPEFLHEHVRGGGEEHAQLIGPEAPAARASDLES